MNIFFFSRMKSFRKDGRVRVILKLRLPRISCESEENPRFNAFYERLSEEYILMAQSLPSDTDEGARPTIVSVDFSVCTDGYIKKHPRLSEKLAAHIVINRETKINMGGRVIKKEHTDIYNERAMRFVK